MKHTPGPWMAPDIMQYEESRINIFAEDTCVGCAYHLTDDPQNADDECKANARLIAAAPDMYDVLKTILDVWDEHKIIGPTVYQDTRAALKKAEG